MSLLYLYAAQCAPKFLPTLIVCFVASLDMLELALLIQM